MNMRLTDSDLTPYCHGVSYTNKRASHFRVHVAD
jgi:hypothetical protein